MSDAVTRALELLDKATPGPWEERRHHFMDGEWMESSVVPVEDGDFREEDGDCVLINSCTADAELIAAAPTLLAELADEVEVERSLRVQMARELLVLTRAAGVPDPDMEDFGGIGSRVLRALTTVDDAMVERAARAVYGAAFADATGWDMANQSMRDTCRTLSNAALDAALGVES